MGSGEGDAVRVKRVCLDDSCEDCDCCEHPKEDDPSEPCEAPTL